MHTRTISITIHGDNESDVDSAAESIEEAMGIEAYEMTQAFGVVVIG